MSQHWPSDHFKIRCIRLDINCVHCINWCYLGIPSVMKGKDVRSSWWLLQTSSHPALSARSVAASLLTGRDIYTHHSLTSLVQDRHYPAACVKHHSRQQQLVALELSQYWALLTMPLVSTNLYGWTLFSDGSPLLYNFLSIIYLDTFRRSLNGNLNLCEYLIGLFLQIFSEDHKTKSYILFVFIISVLL